MEHPVSYSLDEKQLASLAEQYKQRGMDFIQSLDINWDTTTDFSLYHDISDEDALEGISLRIASKELLASGFIFRPEQYDPANFWNTHCEDKTAGIIYSILGGVSLTPPLVSTSDGCDCFFVNSGHNRYRTGFVNKSRSMPLLVRNSELHRYDDLAGEYA